MYLPLQTALGQTHNRNGYSQLAILTKAGVSATDFCTTIENYMNNRFYKDNDSFEISAMSMESIVEMCIRDSCYTLSRIYFCIPIEKEFFMSENITMPAEEEIYYLSEFYKVFGDSTRIKVLYLSLIHIYTDSQSHNNKQL